MGSAYSTKAELKTAANQLFLTSGRRASPLLFVWPTWSGSAAAEALFYCPFLFAPSLFLFPHLFSILSSPPAYFPPLAVVAFRLLAVSDLLGSRCRLRASVRRASGRWVLALAVVVLAPVQALPFQAIVQYVQFAQFISCTFGYF